MYDPTIGRFISEDPIGLDSGDVNFYRYVFNSPTNLTDPSGLAPPETQRSPTPPSEALGRQDFGRHTQQWVVPPSSMGAAHALDYHRAQQRQPQPRTGASPQLQPGEGVTPQFQPGGPSDVPDTLPGKWKVSICAGGGHAWIRYENVETGVPHTTGRYKNGYGGRVNEKGEQVIPPVAVSGIQWDQDTSKEPGIKSGRFATRSVIVDNPKIFKGQSQFGYGEWGNNCTTHARDAWYYYSGEYRYLPGPDLPETLENWIKKKNNPTDPSDLPGYHDGLMPMTTW